MTKKLRILVSDADYVVTMDRKRRVISRGSLVLEDGKIAQVGKDAEVRRGFRKGYFDRVISGKHRVVTPGFIDTHVHTIEHLAKGLIPDDVRTDEWTLDWAYPFYGTTTTESEYVSAMLCCAEMLRTGTTCFLESGARFPENLAKVVTETGIRAAIGPRIMDNPPKRAPKSWNEDMMRGLYVDTDEAMRILERNVDRWKNVPGNGRIRGFVTINGKSTCTDELYMRASELSKSCDVGMHFHLASSLEEATKSEEQYGCWPITRLGRLGVFHERIVLAHVTAVRDDEVKVLKENEVKVSFCPGSALKLAKGAAGLGKYPEMLQNGVAVSLGSDGASAAGSFDMVRQVHMAVGIIKDGRRDATIVTAEQGLEMGTVHGARALRWDDEIGSLEVGKAADVVLFDDDRTSWQPLIDPVQNLVYCANGESVSTVIVDGKVLVDEGALTTIDEKGLYSRVREEVKGSIKRSKLKPTPKWPYS